MDISVVVSTYNRSGNLQHCVEALAAQKGLDHIAWEAVIVDNNSTDDTADVVRELQGKCPYAIRYLFEADQGLSHARNRGIADTTSDYVAFIDDDIWVEPHWLHAICNAFRTHRCDAVGGRIRVDSPLPIPHWVQPEMYGFLGERDFGEEGFFMDGLRAFPFGGNMAVSRGMIERVGMFDTRMGRKGEGHTRSELFKGEETDFFNRVAKAGGKIYYEPRAIVGHRIVAHQLQKRFFRVLHFNAGLQKAFYDAGEYRRTIGGIPLFLFSQTGRAVSRYLVQVLTRGPALAFRQQMNVGYFIGMMQGYRKRAHAT